MRKIKIILLFVCVILFLGFINKIYNEKKSYFDYMKSEVEKNKSMNICIISATEHDGIWGYSAGASGIIVGKDSNGYYALTANHVVNKEKSRLLIMTVFDPSITEYRKKSTNSVTSVKEYYDIFPEAQVIYTNQEEDLAIIYFDTKKDLAVADISQDNPQKHDLIITVGSYSEQMEYFFVSTGKIKRDKLMLFDANDKLPGNQVLQHSAFTAEGFSGGGVYNKEMKLVGMNIGGCTDIFGRFRYSVMIPCEQIQKCIAESNVDGLQHK